jgi:choline dehydrogenase-like flavoprotein
MIIEPKDIDKDIIEEADVCIIGSGAGGAVCAKEISETGKKVVVLEEGGYYTLQDFNQREADMVPLLYQGRGTQATDDLSFTILQGKCIGGSSTVNWTTSFRTPEFVLEAWAKEHGVVGMSRKELDPYFEKVEKYLNIHPVPDEDHNENNRIILDGAKKLGYKAGPTNRNEKGCVKCGFCGLGCAYDVKLSVNITYIPDAVKNEAKFYTNCRAEKIEISDGKKIVKGIISNKQTRRAEHTIEIKAPIVIVACSAIHSPVLLLKSGLANSSGLVGKYLHLHPTTAVAGFYDKIIYPGTGIPQSAVCDEFLNKDGSGFGFWIETVPAQPALTGASLPGFGVRHRELMKKYVNVGTLIVLTKDGANKQSNGEVTVNDYGRAEIKYQLAPEDLKNVIQGIKETVKIHLAAGAKEAMTLHMKETILRKPEDVDILDKAEYGPNQIIMFSAHPMGTCRMGSDPKTSVINSNCESHDVSGLFVIDSSVMPTALGVNPQLTIFGIATKASEFINKEFEKIVS